jgi:Glycosyltransferase family 87
MTRAHASVRPMASNVYGLRLLAKPGVQRIALGLLATIVLGYRMLQLIGFTADIQWGYDFSFYWTAATHVLHGEPIYSAAQLAGPYAPQGQEGFLYPPPFAAVLAPLAALLPADPRAANWLWFGIGLVILVVSVLAVARAEGLAGPNARFALLRGRGAWWLVAGALALPPIIAELVLGNVHLEILGLLSLAWLGLRRGTPNGEAVAGVAIGIAALMKVFPGLLVLWLLASRRYRAALAAVVAAVAVTLITLPVTGVQPWLDYPTVLANLGAPSDTTDTLAPTVWLAPVVGFGLARLLVTTAGVLLVLGLGWRAGGSGSAPGASDNSAANRATLAASFGAAVAASVLIAPAVYQHYLAILVLPLLLGLAAGVRLRWLALAYLAMWGGKQAALGDLGWLLNKGLPTLGALLVLALLVQRVGRLAGGARSAEPPNQFDEGRVRAVAR